MPQQAVPGFHAGCSPDLQRNHTGKRLRYRHQTNCRRGAQLDPLDDCIGQHSWDSDRQTTTNNVEGDTPEIFVTYLPDINDSKIKLLVA